MNFSCWFLAATGVGVPPSFLTNLGEGSTGGDARMGTPEAGVGARMIEGPIGSNPSSSRRGRKYPPRKVTASKDHHLVSPSASLPQGSGQVPDRPVAPTTFVSTPMVIEIDDSMVEVPIAEGREGETVAARRRSPRTPQVHNLIMDLAGALVISFN